MSGEDDKVVGLRGALPQASDAVPGVVSLLEQQLGRAQRGEIRAVCVVYIERDQASQEEFYHTSWDGSRFTLLGALARAMYALNVVLDKVR